MIPRDAIFRSTVIVFCILMFFFFVMGVWLRSLENVPPSNSIVSLKWIDDTSRIVLNDPLISWGEQHHSLDSIDQESGAEQLWHWIDGRILMEDIKTTGVSTDPILLEYIEFFAGGEFGEFQYAAYRLLKKSNMFLLSEREYTAEMTYLFPELPVNIQGYEGERLLTTREEIVDWKTEVLEQQAYVNRLSQYLAKRRFEERNRINIGSSGYSLELEMNSDWTGWILATGIFYIENCRSIPFTQYFYRNGSHPILIPLPWWLLKNTDCLNQYELQGIQVLKHLEIQLTEDDGYLNPSSIVWRLQDPECQLNTRELQVECVQLK